MERDDTVERATDYLAKGSIYVALLDEKGLVTREPFPAISRTGVKIIAEIKSDEQKNKRIPSIYRGFQFRDLHIKFDPSQSQIDLTGKIMMVSGHAHRVRHEEKTFVIIDKLA